MKNPAKRITTRWTASEVAQIEAEAESSGNDVSKIIRAAWYQSKNSAEVHRELDRLRGQLSSIETKLDALLAALAEG